jgi:hypothetical protein
MARKMYLLPVEQYERSIADRDEIKEKINTTDRELHQIINRSDLEEYDKAALYQQALKHLLTYKQQKDSVPPPQLPPPPPQEVKEEEVKLKKVEEEEEEPQQLSRKEIIQSLPKSYRGKANKLLNTTGLEWDGKGRLISNNRTIPDSNIIVLLKGHLTKSHVDKQRARKSAGWNTFNHLVQEKWEDY